MKREAVSGCGECVDQGGQRMDYNDGDMAQWVPCPNCTPKPPTKRAAVAYVTREDGRMLCVWNKRYAGWAMPGGLVEEGEELHQGLERELYEETGLKIASFKNIYDGPVESLLRDGRGSHVHVFRVVTIGEACEREVGCPVTWLTREEFLAWSPFTKFYEKMFEELANAAAILSRPT